MEEPRLETQIRNVGGVPIIDVSGEIDLYTAPVFKRALNQTIDDGHHDIVVNMAEVSYMDSSGFGTLLGITKRVRPDGGTVNLIGCNDAIHRMLKITRLNTVFGLYEDEDSAVKHVRLGKAI
ncbi:MAG TPA: STAS domain-containing protein [Armatimonadota bacterium]